MGGAGGYFLQNGWHSKGGYNGGGGGGGNSFVVAGWETWQMGGGGGGGGLYGGGGGGGETNSGMSMDSPIRWYGGGGGGGGSSLVPSGGTLQAVTSGTSSVTLTYQDTRSPVVSMETLPTRTFPGFTIRGSSGTILGDGDVTVEVYKGTVIDSAQLHGEYSSRRNAATGGWDWYSPRWLFSGTYTVRARQVDTAGHIAYTAPQTYISDDTAPSISLTSPVLGSAVADATPTFSGVAGTLDGDAATVSVKVRNSWAAGAVVQTVNGTRDATTGQYAVTGTTPLPDGAYIAVAEQSDGFQTGDSPWTTFTVDTLDPAPTLVPPPAVRSKNPVQTLTGTGTTATRDAGTVTVRIYEGLTPEGSPVATLPSTLDGSGNYEVDTGPLDDGTWTAQTSQSDSAGNVGLSAPRTFAVDTTAPAVSLASAASQAPPALATYAGDAGTAVGDAAKVTVTVHSGTTPAGALVTTIDTTRDTLTGAFTASGASPLALGTYTAVAKQGDDLGNVTTSAPRTFVVAAAPVPPVTATSGGAGTSTGTTTTATGTTTTATGAPTSTSTTTGSGAPPPAPTAISDADVRRALAGVLAPAGKGATLAAIVEHDYAFAFAAPTAGKLSIDWFTKGRRRPVLIASGRGSFTAGRTARVRVKLNRVGRQALNRAKRLRVTSKATYVIAGRPKVTVRRTFTLR